MMRLPFLLGLEGVHDVLRGPALPGEVSLRAAAEAILGPCLPLTRMLLLVRVGRVRSLLAFLAVLLKLGLPQLVVVGISFLARTPSESLRGEVLFQNVILCLSHLEGVNKR